MATELGDALSGRYGPVGVTFDVNLRDQRNVPRGAMPGGLLQSGSIVLDNDRAISRVAQFQIRQSSLPPSFNSVTDHFAIDATVRGFDFSQVFRVGMFHATQIVEGYGPDGDHVWQITGSDVGYLLQKTKTEQPYEVAAGTNYVEAAREIITLVGLNHSIPDTSKLTPVAFIWAAGTSYLAMLNDLLIGINFHEAFASPTGTIMSSGRQTPYLQPPAVHYRTDAEPRMLLPGLNRSISTAAVPNVLLGQVQDPNRALLAAQVSNLDNSSPWSVGNSGATYAELTIDRTADADTLLATIDFELRLAIGVGTPISIATLFDPRRAAHEVYRLTVQAGDSDTIIPGSIWRVRGWSLPLDGTAPMSHHLHAADSIVLS